MQVYSEITYMDDVVEKGRRFVDGAFTTTYVRYWQLRDGKPQHDAHWRDYLHCKHFTTPNYLEFKKGKNMNVQTVDMGQGMVQEIREFDEQGNPIVPFVHDEDQVEKEVFVQTEEAVN
jgi:hypothetical protein